MRGQHAGPGEDRPWKQAALAVAGWLVYMGVRAAVLMIALFVVVPMAIQRGISGHRPAAHTGQHR
jgi:hypothetical protein